jgi:hypothetical protein
MLLRISSGLVFFLGFSSVMQAAADAAAEASAEAGVVDHGKVKKYFLELYNEALAKAMKEQDDDYSHSSEKRGINFGAKGFSGFKLDNPSSSDFGSKFPKFGDYNSDNKDLDRDMYQEQGFTGFNPNPIQSQTQHTSLRRGGHHHKHHHHKHSHEHTNDHKHAHKHLHEQSHEHKHSAKHQHVHKHEHHHEHNHHHKHKEDHEHKQDHKHSHKHLHAHKGNSWRRQGEEEENFNRRQDDRSSFEPISAEISLEEENFVPIGSQTSKSPKKPEYQDIVYDAWEQI